MSTKIGSWFIYQVLKVKNYNSNHVYIQPENRGIMLINLKIMLIQGVINQFFKFTSITLYPYLSWKGYPRGCELL